MEQDCLDRNVGLSEPERLLKLLFSGRKVIHLPAPFVFGQPTFKISYRQSAQRFTEMGFCKLLLDLLRLYIACECFDMMVQSQKRASPIIMSVRKIGIDCQCSVTIC